MGLPVCGQSEGQIGDRPSDGSPRSDRGLWRRGGSPANRGDPSCVSEKLFLAFWGALSQDSYASIETVGDPILIGYARTSTVEQGASFEAQHAQLKAAGCEKVFPEQVSAVSPDREELEAAIEYAREGDVLVCTKLDRLARSVPHLCEIGKRLDAKKVGLKVLDQASTPPRRPAG